MQVPGILKSCVIPWEMATKQKGSETKSSGDLFAGSA